MSRWTTLKTRYRMSVVAVFASVLIVTAMTATGLLEQAEEWAQDVRLHLRPPRKVVPKIVIVEISDTTLAAWPEPRVFWGTRYARLCREAARLGARRIGLDVVFASAPDEFIIGALDRYYQSQRLPEDLAYRLVLDLPDELHPQRAFRQALEEAPNNTVVLGDNPEMGGYDLAMLRQSASQRLASVAMAPHQGNVVRDALYDTTSSGTFPAPSFPLEIALLEQGARVDKRVEGALQTQPVANGSYRTFRINYAANKPRSAFRFIPAEKLEGGQLSAEDRISLRGAVLLVGATYKSANESHMVPGGGPLTGVEIHANALDTLLEGIALRRLSPTVEGLLTLLLGTLLVGLLPRRFPTAVTSILIVIGVWLAASQWLVEHAFLLPVVGPLSALVAPFFLFHALRSVEENIQRRNVEMVLGKMVAPSVRDFLLDDPSRMDLGGHTTTGSVLFFDIRGSVGFAHSRPPDAVFSALNGLFSEIVPIVDAYGGLLNKFTGDGFMAVYGVLKPMENHAQAAYDTARAIVSRVETYNKRQQAAFQPVWKIGCGVHTGPMAYGNVGVPDRSEFTVIGETPNLAARLELLNKELGACIVISEATFGALALPPEDFVGPVSAAVAGHPEPVRVLYLPFHTVDSAPGVARPIGLGER